MAKNATPSEPPSIQGLIDRREADVRSGRLAGHTPGPWELSEQPDREGRRWINRDGYALAIVCARASSPASGPHYFEKDANARLIAAAPELLHALKELRDNVDRDLSGYWTESTSNFMQQAEAAIAKAEGR